MSLFQKRFGLVNIYLYVKRVGRKMEHKTLVAEWNRFPSL